MSVDNVIMPYCIYHSIDPHTKTCLAYLANPSKTIDADGNHVYECAQGQNTIGKWKLHGTFYGIRPTLRPVPVSMGLIYANRADFYPHDTTKIDMVNDPYTIYDTGVYFITYTQATPGTVPLYLHRQGEHAFPSFDSKPPYASEQKWEIGGDSLPKCYVMREGNCW